MHKTHIFDQKNNAKKIFFTDLPTLFFFGLLQETNNFFLGLSESLNKRGAMCKSRNNGRYGRIRADENYTRASVMQLCTKLEIG